LERQEVHAGQITEDEVAPGQFIVLSIKDTGQGIEPEIKERIFDPYFTTKNPTKGTGLGLSVVYGIVKDLKGFIEVDSTPGDGASFSIYIPALEKEADSKQEPEDEQILPKGTERILVVDDEPAITIMQQSMLQHLGYKVTAMTDSQAALEKVSSSPDQFDLIITDQTMPNLTGVEFAEKVLKIKPELPIILCTGHSAVISEEEALALGIKIFLKKPIARGKLAQIVREVLDNG
jgi:CheY-like chemotaxis protein